MADSVPARLAALEAALARLERRTDPQTLRSALERTFDPRGGEPRIIDSAGRTLDYTPSIQFIGATTELDAPNQRIVVTSGVTYTFSNDGTPSATQRIDFVDETTPAIIHGTVSTSTVGGVRALTLAVANNLAAGSGPYGMLALDSNATTGAATAELQTYSPSFTASAAIGARVLPSNVGRFSAVANDAGGAIVSVVGDPDTSADLQLSATAGNDPALISATAATNDYAAVELDAEGDVASHAHLRAASSGFEAQILAESSATFSHLLADAGPGGSHMLIDESGNTSFMMAKAPAGSGPVRKRITGLLTAVSGTIAAGATATVAVGNAGNLNTGTAALMGGIVDDTASDAHGLTWSWVETGAGNVSIMFKNNDTVNRAGTWRGVCFESI